jgi:hypothetical protein
LLDLTVLPILAIGADLSDKAVQAACIFQAKTSIEPAFYAKGQSCRMK